MGGGGRGHYNELHLAGVGLKGVESGCACMQLTINWPPLKDFPHQRATKCSINNNNSNHRDSTTSWTTGNTESHQYISKDGEKLKLLSQKAGEILLKTNMKWRQCRNPLSWAFFIHFIPLTFILLSSRVQIEKLTLNNGSWFFFFSVNRESLRFPFNPGLSRDSGPYWKWCSVTADCSSVPEAEFLEKLHPKYHFHQPPWPHGVCVCAYMMRSTLTLTLYCFCCVHNFQSVRRVFSPLWASQWWEGCGLPGKGAKKKMNRGEERGGKPWRERKRWRQKFVLGVLVRWMM